MKKLLPVTALSLTLVIPFLAFPQVPAHAYATYNGHVLTGGVGDNGNQSRSFYVNSSASAYVSLADAAMSTWVNSTIDTPITFQRTTDPRSSVIDIYAGGYYDSSTGILAETSFYNYDERVVPTTQNWDSTKIVINNPVFHRLSRYNRQGTIAHEMGHAMGLAHVPNTRAVMCQLRVGRKVNAPQSDDLNGINYLYKKKQSLHNAGNNGTSADFAKIYNSVDDLMQEAEIMIEGKVLEATSFEFLPADAELPTVLTKVKVRVTKSFNDKAKEGDVLTFIEAGGITTKKSLGMDKRLNLPQEKWNEKVQVVANGVPNAKVNDTLLIFGTTPKSDFRVTDEPHYYILGSHQGKFDMKGGVVERFVPQSMNEDGYQSLKMNTSEIEKKIKDKLAK